MSACPDCTFLNAADAAACEVCLARLPKRCRGISSVMSISSAHAPRQLSKYNLFMKVEIARIKQLHPQLTHKEAFKEAAKNWGASAVSDSQSSNRERHCKQAATDSQSSAQLANSEAAAQQSPDKVAVATETEVALLSPVEKPLEIMPLPQPLQSEDYPTAEEERACQSCTFLNPASATTCNLCHAKLPKGREREKAAQEEAAARKAREQAARLERAYAAMPKATMERDGYEYHDDDAFPPGWAELVERAAVAAEALLAEDAVAAERKLETINSHRRQLRFVPEGGHVTVGSHESSASPTSSSTTTEGTPPSLRRYVELTSRSEAILECARTLKRRLLPPEMSDWVAQDLYVLHTPREEEGSRARAPQAWHLDSIKKFAVAALVLRGGHPTEFPAGPYSDFSEGVCASKLEGYMRFWRTDGFDTEPGREAESVEEHEHFTHHLAAAGLTTGAYRCDWDKLEVAPYPRASPGFATTFWSNKVHRGPATGRGEERLVLFCTWLPPGMPQAAESETDYTFKACHLEPKLRLSAAASEAAALEFAGARRSRGSAIGAGRRRGL